MLGGQEKGWHFHIWANHWIGYLSSDGVLV